jgi:uncharacterized membrane protein SirB2
MKRNFSARELALNAIIVALGVGTISFALKFSTFFDNWYWLPSIPNLFDTVFLIVSGLALLVLGLRGSFSS